MSQQPNSSSDCTWPEMIQNADDLDNVLAYWAGGGQLDNQRVKSEITRRAISLGLTSHLPAAWNVPAKVGTFSTKVTERSPFVMAERGELVHVSGPLMLETTGLSPRDAELASRLTAMLVEGYEPGIALSDLSQEDLDECIGIGEGPYTMERLLTGGHDYIEMDVALPPVGHPDRGSVLEAALMQEARRIEQRTDLTGRLTRDAASVADLVAAGVEFAEM